MSTYKGDQDLAQYPTSYQSYRAKEQKTKDYEIRSSSHKSRIRHFCSLKEISTILQISKSETSQQLECPISLKHSKIENSLHSNLTLSYNTDTNNHVESQALIHPGVSPADPFLHYGYACRLLSPRACPATSCYPFHLTQLHSQAVD